MLFVASVAYTTPWGQVPAGAWQIYARVNDTEWSDWIGRTLVASVDSTIASRITDMDFSPEVIESHRRVAEAMLNINAAAASSARGPI